MPLPPFDHESFLRLLDDPAALQEAGRPVCDPVGEELRRRVYAVLAKESIDYSDLDCPVWTRVARGGTSEIDLGTSFGFTTLILWALAEAIPNRSERLHTLRYMLQFLHKHAPRTLPRTANEENVDTLLLYNEELLEHLVERLAYAARVQRWTRCYVSSKPKIASRMLQWRRSRPTVMVSQSGAARRPVGTCRIGVLRSSAVR